MSERTCDNVGEKKKRNVSNSLIDSFSTTMTTTMSFVV